jgi:hypothetical protein
MSISIQLQKGETEQNALLREMQVKKTFIDASQVVFVPYVEECNKKVSFKVLSTEFMEMVKHDSYVVMQRPDGSGYMYVKGSQLHFFESFKPEVSRFAVGFDVPISKEGHMFILADVEDGTKVRMVKGCVADPVEVECYGIPTSTATSKRVGNAPAKIMRAMSPPPTEKGKAKRRPDRRPVPAEPKVQLPAVAKREPTAAEIAALIEVDATQSRRWEVKSSSTTAPGWAGRGSASTPLSSSSPAMPRPKNPSSPLSATVHPQVVRAENGTAHVVSVSGSVVIDADSQQSDGDVQF